MRSVLDCVLEHARRAPERDAVRLVSRLKPKLRRTFGEIAAGAERAAGFLAAEGVRRGEPVVLIGSHHVDFYACWLGAVWLGAVPTILAEPSVRIDKAIYWQRLTALLDRVQARTLLTEPGVDIGADASKGIRRHTYEEVARGSAPAPSPVPAEPGALIVLQHSSGTTGLQKGVMLTHEMIMGHARSQNARTGLHEGDMTASWLPLFHDLGFICCYIGPLVTGSCVAWLSPFEWVQTPALLLEAMTEHRATITWQPNFALMLMAKGVSAPPESFDLSSMRAMYSGGEPITSAAVEAFFSRYERSGLRRETFQGGYGMAEAVGGIAHTGVGYPARFLRVSKRVWDEEHRAEPPGPGEGSLLHVSCGPVLEGCELRVVGSDGAPLPPRRAGRLLLRSTYLFKGYYKREDLHQGLFDRDGFFDTGDTAYLEEDGYAYITGRLKDLVKVGGRNVYPQDVEDIVNTVEGVRPGRVVCFGVPLSAHGTEGPVILLESLHDETKWSALARSIRLAVVKQADVEIVDVKIVPREAIRKSTAGKLARDGNRDWYLAGRFGPLPPFITPSATNEPAATSSKGNRQ